LPWRAVRAPTAPAATTLAPAATAPRPSFAAGGAKAAQDQDFSAPEAAGKAAGKGLLPANLQTARAVIKRASLTVRTTQVAPALARAEAIVAGVGGFVAEERTEANRAGNARFSTLSIRVPVGDYPTVLSQLSRLGHSCSSPATKATSPLRSWTWTAGVASAEASIKRIRLLLDRAQDLGDVISLESELATRQADLEALEAQRAYYADQTTLATIDLTLVSPEDGPPPAPEDDAGFLGGLSAGWHALLALLSGLATGLGALLPFALLALLIGVPLWLLWKSLRQRRVAPATYTGSTAADD
jgi:predicted lipid-binding transport protein (Tim44 family)